MSAVVIGVGMVTADAGASAGIGGVDLPRFVGRLHPVLVHFPIALLIAGLFFEMVSIVVRRNRTKPSPTGLACVALGAIGAGVAAWAGWLNADLETHGRGVADLMETHRWLGIAAAVMAGVALLAGLIGASGRARGMTAAYRVVLIGTASVVGLAGHWGGSMVYGEGYLTAVLFPEPVHVEPEPADVVVPESVDADVVEPAAEEERETSDGAAVTVNFQTQIKPIFERSCIECHGPSKKKGNLRLDARRYVFDERDADAQVIVPGDSWASDLFFRVSLPVDDPDVMPPEGDAPALSASEIGLIEQWIDEGAHWGESRGASVPSEAGFDAPETTDQPEIGTDDVLEVQMPDEPTLAAAIEAIRDRGGVVEREAIGTRRVLVRMDLLGESVTDDDLALLEPLGGSLVSLHLGGTSVTDEGVSSLRQFGNLEQLQLQRTGVTDDGVRALSGLTRLRFLNLHMTGVTDESLVSLAGVPTLARVYVWETGVRDSAARIATAMRPGLEVVTDISLVPAVFPPADDGANDAGARPEQ